MKKNIFYKLVITLLVILIWDVVFKSEVIASTNEKIGTKDNPYRISNINDFNFIRNDLDGYYILDTDINLEECEGRWEPIGSDENPFTGHFNGNGHTIYNLKEFIVKEDVNRGYYGVFGYVQNCEIIGLGIEMQSDYEMVLDKAWKYNGEFGLLVAKGTGVIKQCYAKGNVIGQSVDDAKWHGTAVSANVGSVENAGLLCGFFEGTIEECYTKGNINIASSYNSVDTFVGGIVGIATGEIRNCYSISNITNNAFCLYSNNKAMSGGIVSGVRGSTNKLKIENCYHVGELKEINRVQGSLTEQVSLLKEGVVRNKENSTVEMVNCYYLSQGLSPTPCSGNALSEQEMLSKTTYANWDFENVWTINGGYPSLKNVVEFPNGAPFIYTGGVAQKMKKVWEEYYNGTYFSVSGQKCTEHVRQDLTCDNCKLGNVVEKKGKTDKYNAAGNYRPETWTCMAFARYTFFEIFGYNVLYGPNKFVLSTDLSQAQFGDYIYCYSSMDTTKPSHTAIFLKKEGNTMWFYESNYEEPNKVGFEMMHNITEWSCYEIHHAYNYEEINNNDKYTLDDYYVDEQCLNKVCNQLSVAHSTSWEQVLEKLPSTVYARIYDNDTNTKLNVPILLEWDKINYDGMAVGTYYVEGKADLAMHNSYLEEVLRNIVVCVAVDEPIKLYDVDASVKYARGKYDVTNEKCAGFVSMCLQAGGLSYYCATADMTGLEELGFVKYENLEVIGGDVYITGQNEGKIAVGDILQYYCGTHEAHWRHVAIVTSITSDGKVLMTDANGQCKEVQQSDYNVAYYCDDENNNRHNYYDETHRQNYDLRIHCYHYKEPSSPAINDTYKGWANIENYLINSGCNSVTIAMNDSSFVPENIFECLRIYNKDVILDYGKYKWSIKGALITSPTTLTFEVKESLGNIPIGVMQNNGIPLSFSKELNLIHTGSLGMEVAMSYCVGTQYAGKEATLYYYNPISGQLIVQGKCIVDSQGYVEFKFNHASDYILYFEKKSENSEKDTVTDETLDLSEGERGKDGVTGGTLDLNKDEYKVDVENERNLDINEDEHKEDVLSEGNSDLNKDVISEENSDLNEEISTKMEDDNVVEKIADENPVNHEKEKYEKKEGVIWIIIIGIIFIVAMIIFTKKNHGSNIIDN